MLFAQFKPFIDRSKRELQIAEQSGLEADFIMYYASKSEQARYQTDYRAKVPWFHGVRKKFIWEVP